MDPKSEGILLGELKAERKVNAAFRRHVIKEFRIINKKMDDFSHFKTEIKAKSAAFAAVGGLILVALVKAVEALAK